MSRLYLIILFIGICTPAFSQNYLNRYLNFADEQYQKGDYYHALTYYKKALEIDSNTIDILWRYAETLRAYKDYREAEKYYAIVYDREEARIYPSSLLQLGLMQKQNGKYKDALATFKKAKKKYYKQKKSYLYQKSKKELMSLVWVQSSVIDTAKVILEQLPETVNTKNSEFGHGIYNGQLLFSSLRADSISANEEVYSKNYKTSIYSSSYTDQEFQESERIKSLYKKSLSTGNGSFSLDGSRFYFSQCSEDGYNYRCKIMVAEYSNGKWVNIDSLGSIINEPGTNTTMPCIGELDGVEVLFFASDREDSKGGLDIFYSRITNGNQYSRVRSIKAINSLDNEVTPWWDPENNRLYFSSSWHEGFGGQDIFYTAYKGGFKAPINAGIPFNSPANDLYYFRKSDTSYITSNRLGVLFSKNPTCCSDIFAITPPEKPLPPTPEETLADLNKRLPVTLYFHNDIPNPRSWDTTTSVNYISSYHDYTAMLDRYQKEYSHGLKGHKVGEAKEDIESFFIEYVDKGVSDLQLFRDLLLKELQNGAKINITVKGFASPLAKTDYNVNLTKRRIQSLVNYLREYDEGVFIPYLDGTASNGGRVKFSQIPFGEYTANQLTSDNPNDVKNSVYSRAAAIERKIEIQSVSYFTEEDQFYLTAIEPMKDLGNTTQGDIITQTFVVKNSSHNVIQLDEIRIPSDHVKASIDKQELQPNEEATVTLELNTKNLTGFTVESIYLKTQESKQELRLYVSTEIQ